ncbi:MAG: DUF507 family protein [Proteobacteria bacterium]|nr:DUF507 family protein [Pseudomonadota bacterium]
MSIFSDERVDEIADKIYANLLKKGLLLKDIKPQFKACVRRAVVKFYRINEQVDEIVRKKIRTLSKAPAEGSRDYKILFDKYFIEEWKKH